MKIFNLFFVILALLFTIGCEEDDQCVCDDPSDGFGKKDSLSTLFLDLIASRSKSGDISHFIIPEYTDYASIPQDPNNPITAEKVELGMMLYHDPAAATISTNEECMQTYSCATCHPAECEYQPGIAQGIGDGGLGFGAMGEERVLDTSVGEINPDVQSVKTPSAMNMAFAPNALWDGKLGARGWNEGTEALWTAFPHNANHQGFDGLETQAIVGLKVHRAHFDANWVMKYGYQEYFDEAFPDVPVDKRYTDHNVSMAMAAYERTMVSYRAPFQDFLRGDYDALTESQKIGGILFFREANCVSCHNGTAFANIDDMFAIGLNDMDETNGVNTSPQKGRSAFTGNPMDDYKFKVPQLYNLKGVGFYGHGSSMASLRAMIEYCATGSHENKEVPDYQLSSMFVDRHLTKTQLDYLDDFVRNALYDPEIKRHKPDFVASGFCFPNADPQSKIDLDCSDEDPSGEDPSNNDPSDVDPY